MTSLLAGNEIKQKMALPGKKTLFFVAPSPLKQNGGFLKGCHPFNLRFEGAVPLAALDIFRASGCPEMHTLA